MPTNREILKLAQTAQISSNPLSGTNTNDSARDTVAAAHSRVVTNQITDGGTAGTAVTETVIARLPNRAKVTRAELTLPVAITASDTDTVIVTLARRTAGAASVTIGTVTITITGGVGNVTAFLPVAFTLTAANVQCAAGDVLTIRAAKAGSGKAIAAATSSANVTVIAEEN